MRRIPVAIAAATLLLLALLPPAALLYVNSVLLPQELDRAEAMVEAACGCEVELGGARLLASGRIELQGIEAVVRTGGLELRADARGAAVETSLRSLIRARGAIGELRVALAASGSPPSAAETGPAWHTLEALADAGVLPDAVEVTDARVLARHPLLGSPVEISTSAFRVVHNADLGSLFATASPARAPGFSASFEAQYRSRRVEAEVVALELEAPHASAAGLDMRGDTIGLHLELAMSGGRIDRLKGMIDIENAVMESAVVAPDSIGPIDIRYSFSGSYDPHEPAVRLPHATPAPVARHFPRGVLSITDGTLAINGVHLGVRGALRGMHHPAGLSGTAHPVSAAPALLPRFIDLDVEIPRTPVDRINDAVPAALKGPLRGLDLGGSFGWSLRLRIPRYDPGGARWHAQADLRDFSVLEIPPRVNPYGLNGSFVHTIRDPAVGYEGDVLVPAVTSATAPDTPADGAGAPNRNGNEASGGHYVRLSEMSEWIPAAVLTTEDGDFYYHDGINFRTMARAAVRNLRAGEVLAGASTITMQLVKMLYLDDDRIIARKLQEVFLVFLIEHQVPVSKDRILEIYLNIAEFGPGVFGVREASRYYFDADPADLTLGEAMWLATVLPSPKRYHYYYEQGAISDGWFIRMKSYYDVMLERERLTPQQYAAALEDKPVFAK